MEKYILPFLYSFSVSTFAIFFLLRVLPKVQPSSRRRLNLRRLGGAVVIFVFVLLALTNKDLVITKSIVGIITGGMLILLFGLWDDLKNLNWKWQLTFQIIIAFVAISFGVKSDYITNPFGGIINFSNPAIYFLLYTLYFLVFINSLNWLDGIDGLAGGVSLVSVGVIFSLSLLPHVNQPAVAILSAIAGGAILGFLIFNWHPAKIIAGTAGAWFFGFLLASLSIFAGAKIATVLMTTLIPVLDLARVIWERYQAGWSVFRGGDDRHLHHKLLKLEWDKKKIVLLVCAVSIFVGAVALNLGAIGKLFFIIFFFTGYFGFGHMLNAKIFAKGRSASDWKNKIEIMT